MGLELDHVFVCVGDTSHANAALTEFGLNLSMTRVHQGQGTRNACAFFDNAYLELLWRHNDADLQSRLVRPLMLWERLRWRETGACPFGVALRPTMGEDEVAEVETWDYEAPFLPKGSSIPIVTPRNSPSVPLIFLSLGSMPPAILPFHRRPALEQRGSRRRLTAVRIGISEPASLSSASRDICARCGVEIAVAPGPHVELEWNHGSGGSQADFTSALPLSIRW